MKIKPEHYEYMRAAIASLVEVKGEPVLREHYELLKTDDRVRDVGKRFRWDLQYAAKISAWVCDNIYPYAEDDHIDTAMRRIVKELNLSFDK